jgi:hypothetical protein
MEIRNQLGRGGSNLAPRRNMLSACSSIQQGVSENLSRTAFQHPVCRPDGMVGSPWRIGTACNSEFGGCTIHSKRCLKGTFSENGGSSDYLWAEPWGGGGHGRWFRFASA